MTRDYAGLGPSKLAWPPSRPDRFGPNGWRKLLPIWSLLVMMDLTSACAKISAPGGGCEWAKPIILAEKDKLTTETKRALLVHNEAQNEFSKLDD